MQLDNHTPYGHVAANARPESRLLVRVVIRDGHMGQMLNDGRSYASGTHTLQIYKSELPALMRLLETREKHRPLNGFDGEPSFAGRSFVRLPLEGPITVEQTW